MDCFGCDSGVANLHQDGAKSWIECECGKFKTQPMDMSDADHTGQSLIRWNNLAQEYAAQLSDKKEVETGGGADTDDGQQEGQDQPPEGAEGETNDAVSDGLDNGGDTGVLDGGIPVHDSSVVRHAEDPSGVGLDASAEASEPAEPPAPSTASVEEPETTAQSGARSGGKAGKARSGSKGKKQA